MSNAGMLAGGFRVSSGRPFVTSGGRTFGQSFSYALSLDRDSERVTKGAATDSSEGSLHHVRGSQGLSTSACCSASYESPAVPSRSSVGSFTKKSVRDSDMCDHSPTRPPSISRSPSASICRSREGRSGLLLSAPILLGFNLPSLDRSQRSGAAPSRSASLRPIKAMGGNPEEGKKALSSGPDFREAGDMLLNKGSWNTNQYLSSTGSESEESWEQINMILRVMYAMAMYGGLAVAGSALCAVTGVDCSGGFELSIETVVQGLGYAVPPMMALLFILEDEVVKVCPPARAIRDVEDEELIDFFVGMSSWQFIFVVAAGALAEEMFFRVAIQGGLAHALQYTAKDVNDTTIGISALTGIIPFFTPFAQACAAVLTASLTGSMYYVISSPTDPTYVIAPVSGNKFGRNNRRDIKKRISAWYERRQLKKIYSPLMEALLALYLGFEWVQTGNILGPMITHSLYSLVVVGNGLRRIHDNRDKLRQRVSKVTQHSVEGDDLVRVDRVNQTNLSADEAER
ncbi:CAAX protease family protein [Marchantia polymorpha subsp. ruderalis]|uniref:CAAX prenyl protease 2/Lysostaphin resistance protein A-like domain-containing protein n=1 Tax=Marchantia polymorpha TaxID=3197 RepID=A0A2R6XMI4_MARPO|nr:hypothetical protein MARPO_0008s0099 [Marchantia polymorpha]PTQ47328.1 hypothetical protein MARPO_0008s0099 [Marchantia polymorpha]BBN19501.1 hypothetical protein Mp_8g11220 [Marchantia polymorpha subsp. ruderalis]BBN19502.1 hypothetical protein Mp_8g11220 [Marchantia polymorpha subsp. ruderalis]|eukprot:PTQ47327.1 hypothetical protein MARPO_0008s0099 [Marchantia polymorpha]